MMKPYEANNFENELKQRMAKMAKTPPSLLWIVANGFDLLS